jgi:uncharacterized protein YneF (UPF0154 family)
MMGMILGFFLFRKSMRNGKEHGNMAATALLGS